MDFLGAFNRVRRECAVTGGDLLTLETGLSAEGKRFVDWVGQAWQDVQTARPDWQWMRKTATFSTVASQQGYTLAQSGTTDMAEWLPESFRSYPTTTGVSAEQFMEFVDYASFRDLYLFSTYRSQTGWPLWWTYGPDHTLLLWPTPDATAYTVVGEYYRTPTALTLNTDDPSTAANGLPARFHMLLIYKAMKSYAAYESAPEVYERAMAGEKREMGNLEMWGLPMIGMAGSLA